jgi:hypothetical protein
MAPTTRWSDPPGSARPWGGPDSCAVEASPWGRRLDDVEPKRDMDERFNVEGDPEEVLAALLAVDPDDDPDDD